MQRINKGEKGKPIKGLPAARDLISGAVVFDDQQGYQRAIKRKRSLKNQKDQELKMQRQEKLTIEHNNKIITLEKCIIKLEDKLNKITKYINKNK